MTLHVATGPHTRQEPRGSEVGEQRLGVDAEREEIVSLIVAQRVPVVDVLCRRAAGALRERVVALAGARGTTAWVAAVAIAALASLWPFDPWFLLMAGLGFVAIGVWVLLT